MAKDEGEPTQITIPINLRRLLTGVPRTKRAPSAIPRLKKVVLRHIDPDWRDAIWDERRGVHRVWIDDFLNQTIWSRGRGHVGGPKVWTAAKKEGQRPKLAKRTAARYGSILKVKVLFVEEPGEGGDPRIDVYLYGYEDQGKDDAEESHEGHDHGDEEGEDADDGGKGEDKPAAKPAAKEEPKKPASASAAAKSTKPAAAKPEPKKAAAAPKKEGGD